MRPIALLSSFLPTALLLGLAGGAAHASQETHGGDGFVLSSGQGVLLLDDLECTQDFFPEDYTEAWALIDNSLTVIAEDLQLPNLAAYLRSYFIGGRLHWCFVAGALKDVEDEGPTKIDLSSYLERFDPRVANDPYSLDSFLFPDGVNKPIDLDKEADAQPDIREIELPRQDLILSFGQQQIAVNGLNGMVQISRPLFEKLETASVAKLFWHEVLWHAAGFTLVEDGSTIRNLSNLMASANLSRYRSDRFVAAIDRYLGKIKDKSPLGQRAKMELNQSLRVLGAFQVKEHDTRFGYLHEVEVKSDQLSVVAVTAPNANKQAPLVYTDKYGSVYYSPRRVAPFKLVKTNLESICGTLELGARTWRLPSAYELSLLEKYGLSNVTWLNQRIFVHTASVRQPTTIQTNSFTTPFLFPIHSPAYETFPMLTKQGKVVDAKKNFIDISHQYPPPDGAGLRQYLAALDMSEAGSAHKDRQTARRFAQPLTYTHYVCVSEE